MPSLSTNNQNIPNRIGTFDHCIIKPTWNDNDHPNIDINDESQSQATLITSIKCSNWLKWFKHGAILTSMFIVTGLISALFNLIDTKYPHFYTTHLLYYFSDFTVIIGSFISFAIHTVVLNDLYDNKWTGILQCFLMYIIVFGGFGFAVIYNYSHYNSDSNSNNSFAQFTHTRVFSLSCDKYFNCQMFEFGYFYMYWIVIGAVPICQSIVLLFVFGLKYLKIKYNHKFKLQSRLKDNSFDYESVSNPLNINIPSSCDQDYGYCTSYEENIYNTRLGILRIRAKIAGYISLIFVTWATVLFVFYLLSNLQDQVLKHDWDKIYWIWLCTTSFSKYIGKKFAHSMDKNRIRLAFWQNYLTQIQSSSSSSSSLKEPNIYPQQQTQNTDANINDNDSITIDQSPRFSISSIYSFNTNTNTNTNTSINNINNTVETTIANNININTVNVNINLIDIETFDDNNIKLSSKIYSFEWNGELYFSMIYWIFYRQYAIYYVTTKLTGYIFYQTIAIHFISELTQTIKLTHEYFNITSKIENYFYHKNKFILLLKQKFFLVNKYNWFVVDDSNYYEWVARCSIDVMIRFIVSNVTVLWFLFYLIWFIDPINQYTSGKIVGVVKYTLIAFATEFLHFVLVLFVQFRAYRNDMPLLYFNNFKAHITKFTLSWLLVNCFLTFDWLYLHPTAAFNYNS